MSANPNYPNAQAIGTAGVTTNGGHKKPLPNLRLKIATDLFAAMIVGKGGISLHPEYMESALKMADQLIELENTGKVIW